jgi:hypothetical protein
MNIKEVPQDDEGFLKKGKIRDLCYATDEDGNYKQVLSLGWEPKNEAVKQAWTLINEKTEMVRIKVINGEISPLAYFIEKNVMTPKLVSQYTGIPLWRIKRHLRPKVFKKIKPEVLQKYTDLFNISLKDLTQLSETKD